MKNLFSQKNLGANLSAGFTVFLVAIPLCLGIAIASGAPPLAGLIAGILGGIVVGGLSNSPLSVSGPAAGLVGVVLLAIQTLGSYEAFLLAVMLAGLIQIIMGIFKLGSIANYFPTSVIKGMLAAIGILIIKKQLPHFVGYDADKAFSLAMDSDEHALERLMNHAEFITWGAALVGIVSLAILVLFEQEQLKKKIKFLPASLIAVLVAVGCNQILKSTDSSLALGISHLVQIPVSTGFKDFISQFTLPDFSIWNSLNLYKEAVTIALVATIETLLCIEAVDKIDPLKRRTSYNRELYAQGIGNMLSGLIGGLPITSVIVRSSANVSAGGTNKISAIFHGILLLLSIVLFPFIINMVPLSALAAILLVVGYKLAKISFFKEMYQKGPYQFWPFIITVLAIVLSDDLLMGVGIGLVASIFSILRANLKNAYYFHEEKHHKGDVIYIQLADEVSFLNKASIKETLDHLPQKSTVVIDASNSLYIDYDVLQIIRDFQEVISKEKQIALDLIGFKPKYQLTNSDHVISKSKADMLKQNIQTILPEEKS